MSCSRRPLTQRFLGWSDRTRLRTIWPRKPLANSSCTAKKPSGCERSRNSWCSAEPKDLVMSVKSTRKRLDVLVVERGLAESRQKAQAMILAGEVSVDGSRAEKAGAAIPDSARIEVHSRLQKYASRGGFKLEGALEDLNVAVSGRICLDIGSSIGGFARMRVNSERKICPRGRILWWPMCRSFR